MTNIQQKILQIVWASGGFCFGGTSRDLLRGEEPNDLDLRLGQESDLRYIKDLGACVVSDRAAEHGEAYYDKAIVFDSGEKLHIKHGWVEVTDCDINLIKLYKDRCELLYTPSKLQFDINPLAAVINHIHRKEFIPLTECAEHRKYRWDEFVKRGWKKL